MGGVGTLRGFGRASAILLAMTTAPVFAAASPQVAAAAPVQPDVFDTISVPTRYARFTDQWRRVSAERPASAALTHFVAPARHLDPAARLAFVQAAASRTVRWRSDATQYGQRDYWARAEQTLASRLGDSVDVAILKMQALKALGFARRDLYLCLGRDSVRGPDQAVLLVRSGGRFWVLGEGGGPVPAERRGGFSPLLTFADNAVWLHGKRFAGGAPVGGSQ